MNLRFQPAWQVQVQHAFRGASPADELTFLVPEATRRRLAGLRALARQRLGQLHLLLEVDDANQSLAGAAAWAAAAPLLFGLMPHAAGFAHYTALPATTPDEVLLWENAPDPQALAAARVVRWADVPEAAEWLARGERPIGLLRLHPPAAPLAAPRLFTLPLAARQDTLRYYVVARPFPLAEFDTLQVVDEGAAAEGRAPLSFRRLLPPAFTAAHLSPSLLDATGTARLALFEAETPTPRRERGSSGLRLRVNAGDTLFTQLPTPGALKADAQFVVHVAKA